MYLKKIGILEKDGFSKKALDRLRRYYEVLVYDNNEPIEEFIADKYALFVRLAYQINDALIEKSACLRYICSPTTGLNHISVSSSEIEIISLKGEFEFLSSIRATPEHIMGLTFSLLRNYKFAFRSKENSSWDRNLYRGYEIYNSSVGIIGCGRIGTLLCEFFLAFGGKVHVFEVDERRRNILKNKNVELHDCIEDVILSSDIVILCVSYEPQNKKMINKKHFELLGGKYFINASRGELVDENDMLDFLKTGDYKGVALDVFANETGDMGIYKKLLETTSNKNVIITPHIGGATFTSMHRTEEFIAEKLIKIDGQKRLKEGKLRYGI